MTRERVGAFDSFDQHMGMRESDEIAIARAREIAASKSDFSSAIAAMVTKAHNVGAPPSEQTTTPDTTDARSRLRLREAIAVQQKAHAQYVRAAQAVSKADSMLRVAEADLTALGDPDAALAAHRAALMREGSAAVLEVPPELAERQNAKAEVERRIREIGAVKAQLAGELDDARQRLADAQSAVQKCALHVLIDHAAVLTSELAKVREDLCRGYDHLMAIANTWLPNLGRGTAMGPVPIPTAALKELQLCEALTSQRRSSGSAPDWRSVYDALLHDADASLPGEPQP